MLTFRQLQDEVKRRSVRDQAGTQYDTAIKNALNFSLFTVARSAAWRSLRRKYTLSMKGPYDTSSGNGSFTDSSTTAIVTGATFMTDDIENERRIKLSGDGTYHTIYSVTAETILILRKPYSGTATTTGTYEILGQESYSLPFNMGHRLFIWHEEYGYPLLLTYLTDQEFLARIGDNISSGIPEYYRMWGEDTVITQPFYPSAVTIRSTSTADTNIGVTVYGIDSSGYPTYEVITTDSSSGTTYVYGTVSWRTIDRVIKNKPSVGHIKVEGGSSRIITVIPKGDMGSAKVSHIQVYPIPDSANYRLNIQYYKEPFPMYNDGDCHELGGDFDEAIIMLSVSKIKHENSQTEGEGWYKLYNEEMRTLRRTNVDKLDWLTYMKRPCGVTGDSRVAPNLLYRQAGSYYGPSSR